VPITKLNRDRGDRLAGKTDRSLLGPIYPGIQMAGLPKGLRMEASVSVTVLHNVDLIRAFLESSTVRCGGRLGINYEIESGEEIQTGIWLGASLNVPGRFIHNIGEDKSVSLTKGSNTCQRSLTIPKDAPIGFHRLSTSIWQGVTGDSRRSKRIVSTQPIPFEIVE
jgi:hypothetical protein